MRNNGIFRKCLTLLAPILLLIVVGMSCAATSEDAVWPENSGTVVETDGKLVIDASQMDQGYVMCCVSAPTENTLMMRVTYSSGAVLDYVLDNTGGYDVIPLQLGSGNYEFALYENVSGTKYSSEGKITLSVQLSDENAPFLAPNQYVDYARTTNAVVKSDELATQSDIYQAVCDFMTNEFQYDFARAEMITKSKQFVLPEIAECFDARAGVCQDLSAIMVCMLRVQGIPAKLIIGYADRYYHAWTTALVDGKAVLFDPTHAIGCINASNYMIERFY